MYRGGRPKVFPNPKLVALSRETRLAQTPSKPCGACAGTGKVSVIVLKDSVEKVSCNHCQGTGKEPA